MASSSCSLQISLLFFFFPLISSHNPILPKAAIFPVQKDSSTLQYVSKLFMGQDLGPLELVVDLGGPFVWADCDSLGSHHQPIKSCSLKCSMAKPIKACAMPPGYNSNTCTVLLHNTISGISGSGEVVEDNIAMGFWDGKNPNSFAQAQKFMFSCAPHNSLLSGLANGAKGVFALGDSRTSLPSQISTTFGFFQRKFSLCLSPSEAAGAIFIGGGPQISTPMVYTPLKPQQGSSYYMGLSSIKISGKKLCLQQKGVVGVKLSSVVPYTTLETRIYATFVEAYVKAAKGMNLSLVSSVAPFEVCFGSKAGGANVPIIDLVLQSEMVKWRVYGKNSMVFVSDEIMCLGFMDGGINPRDMIVVGGYQMEDYLLEFDLGSSMLGISALVMGPQKCSDFAPASGSELF